MKIQSYKGTHNILRLARASRLLEHEYVPLNFPEKQRLRKSWGASALVEDPALTSICMVATLNSSSRGSNSVSDLWN